MVHYVKPVYGSAFSGLVTSHQRVEEQVTFSLSVQLPIEALHARVCTTIRRRLLSILEGARRLYVALQLALGTKADCLTSPIDVGRSTSSFSISTLPISSRNRLEIAAV